MLTTNEEEMTEQASASPLGGPDVSKEASRRWIVSDAVQPRIDRFLRIEWLGQTVASICWIGSVLAYGISSFGDWLQLFAASSWLLANIAAVVTVKAD